MSLIPNILKRPPTFFLLLICISFLIYIPGIEGRFTSDFYNWIRDYKHGSLSELWTCFGYPGLHQLYHIPFYFSYKIFGLNIWAWHFEFTFLHSINGFLVFYTSKEFLSILNKNTKFAYLTSMLFLLSPFQTEVVSWGATIHYLFTLMLFLIAFLGLIRYLKTKENKYLIGFHIFFILDLLTMELPLVFPAIFFIYAFVFRNHYNISVQEIIKKILLINFLTLILYFVVTKLVVGNYVGHYGLEHHIQYDIKIVSDSLYFYLLKFLTFYRYLEIDFLQKKLFKIFSNDFFKITSFILICLSICYYLVKDKIHDTYIILINLLFFSIALLPVLNIEMSSLKYIMTDRYSYVASVFFFIGLTIIFSKLKTIYLPILYLSLSIFLLTGTINIWKETGFLANKIIDSYTFEGENVYAINNIDNHRGAYLFKNGFVAAMELQKNIFIKEEYYDISKVYSNTVLDSVTIEQRNGEIEATTIPWGRWFWLKESDNNYQARLGYIGQSVIINPQNEINIIHLKAGKWEKLKY